MNPLRFILVGMLFALTACAPVFPSAGVTTDTNDFTVEAHADSWRGRPVVAGYIHNKRPLRATRVQLRVEASTRPAALWAAACACSIASISESEVLPVCALSESIAATTAASASTA